ncbi:MAG: ABC transporter permease, partial [Eubacteriaceae bacterium]|nr:ABC transporter permease [Eubacteriaceae bacterium]
ERTGDTFNFHPGNTNYVKTSDLCMVDVMTLADYNAITGKNVALSGNQVLAHGNSFIPGDTLHLLGEDYTVTEKLSAFPLMETEYDKNYGLECLSLVVADQNVMGNLAAKQASAYGDAASPLIYTISFNVTGSFNDKITCCKALNEPGALSASVDSTNPAIVTADQLATPGDSGQWDIRNRQNEYQTFYYAYGGILFLGILLGTVFLMAAVLIIYYKQVSEGYDDRSRFVIMQNVGMSQTEVKKAIRSQILTVFFLPLIVAACHVVFAFPVITKLLNLFSLFDTGLFIRCTLLVFATFAAVYAITFLLTARTYYKIIRK